MDPAVVLAVQHGRPGVAVRIQPGPGRLLELVQRALDPGGWGSACDRPDTLPAELVGFPIEVRPRQGAPWTATVLAVVRRDSDRVLVRPAPHSGK